MSILEEAHELVRGDRNRDYGHPLDNHGTTAALFSAYLEALRARTGSVQLRPEDVCFLNILQKVSRAVTSGVHKRDTQVDIAGYAENVEMIQAERQRRECAVQALKIIRDPKG